MRSRLTMADALGIVLLLAVSPDEAVLYVHSKVGCPAIRHCQTT